MRPRGGFKVARRAGGLCGGPILIYTPAGIGLDAPVKVWVGLSSCEWLWAGRPQAELVAGHLHPARRLLLP